MTVMKGKEAIMKALSIEGVEYVFGVPGSTELLFLDALQDHPEMKYILGLHEVVSVGMADGYTRLSGKVGVVNLHTCAGLAAAMPALYNAYLGRVPLLLTAGQQDTRLFMQEPDLAGDLTGISGHFTKWSTEICYAADIPIALRRAFKVATQPPTGPVFVSLPQDIMEESLDFEYVSAAALPVMSRPDQSAIEAAAELLTRAQAPVIFVGHGVTRYEALGEVVELAELIGARVYQRWMGDVNFPTGHPQYLGTLNTGSQATGEMLLSVDVVIAIGEPLLKQSFYLPEPLITARNQLIQIDDNPWEIAKNFPVDAGITGNIKVSLTELNSALADLMTEPQRRAAVDRAAEIGREKEKLTGEFSEKARQEQDRVPIAVSRLMRELADALRPGTLVIDEGCSASATMIQSLNFNEPLSYKGCRAGGSIGWGIPAALGARLAVPERPIVAVIGDGAAMWSIQGLWTAAHYGIPVTFVIVANAGYNTLKARKHRWMGDGARGRYLGMDFDEPRIDFCQIARSMGVEGFRVERPEELGGVLGSALEADKLSLIEVRTAASF